jgi:hypothetical protein
MKMASTTQDELYQSFLRVAGQQTSALGDATALLAEAIAQVSGQQSGSPAQVTGQQTSALGNTTESLADVIVQAREQQSSNPAPIPAANQTQTGAQTGSSSGSSTSGTVEKTMLEAEAGLPLLIAGLVSAFGGGGSSTPPPLVKYAMPAAVDFQAAESEGQVSGLDYDQMGTPRSYAAAGTSGTASGTANGAAGGMASGTTSGTASSGANGGGSGSGGAPQITFNVQAMDARSFMDRSGDIAAAVRDAMLNLNSINDVVNDL